MATRSRSAWAPALESVRLIGVDTPETVYLPDGQMLNAEIVAQGYGFAYTKYPFTRIEEFRRLEREAREQERGL